MFEPNFSQDSPEPKDRALLLRSFGKLQYLSKFSIYEVRQHLEGYLVYFNLDFSQWVFPHGFIISLYFQGW